MKGYTSQKVRNVRYVEKICPSLYLYYIYYLLHPLKINYHYQLPYQIILL